MLDQTIQFLKILTSFLIYLKTNAPTLKKACSLQFSESELL